MITLSNGIEIEVHTPPVWKSYSLAEKKYPMPEKPVVTETTVTGSTVSMIIEDDPKYLAAMESRDDLIREAVSELNWLFALRDVVVPEDFDINDLGDEIRYADPDWQPRPGPMGRKLDYIEFDLLASPRDQMVVQQAINEATTIDEEEVASIADSFQS